MKILRRRQWAISLITRMNLCFVIGIGAAAAVEPGDDELAKRLCEQWDSQRTAVQSAVIEYRSVRREAQPKQKPADVVALIEPGDWVTNERSLRSLVPKLDNSLQGANELWGTSKFTTDGPDAREDVTSQQSISSLVHCGAGAYDIKSRTSGPAGGNQIDIYVGGQCRQRMPAICDFIFIPPEKFCRKAAIDHTEQLALPGRIVLKNGLEEVVADKDTGFVFEYHFGIVNDRFYQEAYQFAPAKHGDILLPTGIFSGRYKGGMLNSFTILIIDNATLNQPVAPAAFTVSGNQGDIVVDRTAGPGIGVELDRNVIDILQR
jgi:hypothetical protein